MRDHRLRAGSRSCGRLEHRPRLRPDAALDLVPVLRAAEGDEGLEAVGVLGDEGVVEDRGRPARVASSTAISALQMPGDRGDVAAGLDLVILRR